MNGCCVKYVHRPCGATKALAAPERADDERSEVRRLAKALSEDGVSVKITRNDNRETTHKVSRALVRCEIRPATTSERGL